MGFVHLHNHTEYSALDGLTRVARAPKRAAELGQNAVSTTDHGDIRAGFEFQKACLEAGVKAIHGCEFYLAFGSRFEQNFETVLSDDDTVSDADEGKEKAKRYMHLTVLARTQQGFKNLIKLHNRSYELREDGASAVWYKPRIDFELLKEYGEGLIVLTGCLGGPVAGPLSRAAFLENQVSQIEGAHEKIDYYAALDRELSAEEIADKKKAENLGSMSGEADIKLQDAATLRKTARENLDTLIDAVGRENVFLEVMYHRIDAERFAYMELMKLSKETGIPMVATNDCHYEHQEESYHHDGFLAVGVKRNLDDPTRFSFNGEPTYYMRSEQEMLDVLGNHPDPDVASSWRTAVANSQMVADLCEEQTLIIPKEDEYLLPKFPLPEGYDTAEQYLHHLVGLGARRRYGDDFATARQDVVDRLTEELRVINVMGFPDYFLIVQDMVNWARSDYLAEDWVASNGGTIELPYERKTKKPILVGPGRGSAAGAAVSYVLGIVDICPLRYNLLFERFLEEGRAGMPDIDLDFERDRRHEVHQFVVIRWGKDNVAHIGSTNYALTKAAIKDAARILQPSADPEALKAASELRFEGKYAEAAKLQSQAEAEASRKASAITRLGNELAKLVPDRYSFEKLENVHDSATEKYRELVEEQWELAEPILELAKSFEGVAKAASIHPCGFIISPVPLDDVVPMRVNSDDPNDPRVITWSDKACEGMGLLKMDILGIQNLDIISKAFEGIERNQGISLSMDTLPDPDDASDETVLKAYQLLSRGDTSGVFQSESGGMRNVYRDVQPSDLNDLSAVIALFRPGPLAAGVPDLYAKRKHGMQEVDYTQFTKDPVETQWLDSVLSETFGLFCVAEGEPVYSATRGRFVPIEEIEVGELVQGVDDSGAHSLAPVLMKQMTGHREVVKVSLAGGVSIRVTDDHRILTASGWKEAGELTASDVVATPKQLLSDDSESGIDIHKARVLGFLLGDGSITQGTSVEFVNSDESVHSAFSEAVSLGFQNCGTRHVVQVGNVRRQAVTSGSGTGGAGGTAPSSVLVWLRELGLKSKNWREGGLHSRSKFIPEQYVTATGDAGAALIAALWDCDGHIASPDKPKSAHYKTISARLANDLVCLLARNGIPATICKSEYTNPSGRKEVANTVVVNGFVNFCKLVAPHLSSETKRENAVFGAGVVTRRKVSYGSRVPTQLVLELIREAGYTPGKVARLASLSKAYTLNKFLGASVVESIAAVVGSAKLDALVGSRWTPVLSVSPDGSSDVWDLSVDNVHSFVGGSGAGMVVHNCFQEQLMRLGTVIAGFDAGQRSTLRRAVGKKKKSDMDKVGLMLEAGAEQEFYDDEGNLISPSFTKETAARFFEQAKGSAEYLFNASHSAAYAQLAFVTAYLKANWPVEYGAAILATSDKEDKRISALQDLRAAGIRVDAPDVNLSLHDTSAVGDRVVIGFKEIKNVGSVGAHIFAEREANGPFASMSDVFSRVHIPNGDGKPGVSKISTGAVQGLIESGAFDAFGPRLGQIAVMRAARETEVQPLNAEWTVLEKSARQRSLIGVTVGTHPISHHAEYLSQWRTPARDGYSRQRLGQSLKPLGAAVAQASIEEGPYYPVTGGIVAGWEEKAFSGGRRAIMQLESPSITVETMIWDKTLGELMEKKQVPRIGDLIAVSGQMKIKTTTIGNTEEAGAEEGEMVETITVPSISMKAIFQIDDPEETTWDLTKPDFDVAGTFAALNEVDLPALRKAERAALKAAEKASGSAPSKTAAAPVEAAQVEELPLDIVQEPLVEEQPADPEPGLSEPGASESFAVPAPVATGVEARHYRWRKSTISPRLAKLTNTGDFKQFSSATMGKGFATGTVRYQVTPADGIKFIIDASPAAGSDKALKAMEIMEIVDALDVLPQGVPCEHFDGWYKFDIAEVAS